MSVSALTIKSNGGLLRQLTSPVDVFIPNQVISNRYYAILDTGASGTVITQEVVNNLGLIPTGMSIVHTANGVAQQNTYIIDIALSEGILLRDITVTCATALSGGCNILIGMDIINQGDFSITNKNGITCMSFRIPSMHEIDFCAYPNLKANSTPKRGSNITPPKKKRK
jgi:predicted aspartyl protease